ncbi:hypothetical protein [Nafulsella turpanensis]|uniref:hypothetical protein n=1 Tax=Nafulsella turpanensis TaxID=1265690 RepID=UPI00034A5FB5|nr:hypothetical protein [Nafulsella turpanensis]
MSGKKYIITVLLIAAVISLAGYIYLGGFKDRELALVEVNNYHLIGKHYTGTLQNEALGDIFFEVQDKVQQDELEGVLTVVVLKEPVEEKDTVEQFIGVLTEQPVEELPEGWEHFTVEADQAVRSTIRSHNMVMAKPNVIREELEAFAKEQGLKLQPNISIEKYIGERHLEIEVPVEE